LKKIEKKARKIVTPSMNSRKMERKDELTKEMLAALLEYKISNH